MDILQITSFLLVFAAGFGAINYLFFKLPSSIGMLVVSLLASLGTMGIDALMPELGIAEAIRTTITGIDFSTTLLGPVDNHRAVMIVAQRCQFAE